MSSQYKRALIILADGARFDVLDEEQKKGNLPNISRLFCEQGTYQDMLSCFPSTTGPAYLPYVTGCFPGTCNVPGIRWFDKQAYAKWGWGFWSFRSYCGLEATLFDYDTKQNIQTAWELFDNPKSILNGVTKGLKRKFNLTRYSRLWHYFYAHMTNRWSLVDDAAYARTKQMIRQKDFDFAFTILPSIDEYAHTTSPHHPRVREAYKELDDIVGNIYKDLESVGWHEDTLLAIVSDHGHCEVNEHFDVGPWLQQEKHIKTFYYSNIFKFGFDAVSMVSGNGMSHLYFKGQEGWGYRKTFEEMSYESLLLDELRMNPAVDLVVSQGADDSVHLQTKRGHGSFKIDSQNRVWYQFDRDDPLGLFTKDSPQVNGSFALEDSLALTYGSQFPDVFMQMHQIFRSRRTGDVMISAAPGYDFRQKFERPLHTSGHGAISPPHMKIPLLMNHKLSVDHVRSVDVYPTVLELLGKKTDQVMDGQSLVHAAVNHKSYKYPA